MRTLPAVLLLLLSAPGWSCSEPAYATYRPEARRYIQGAADTPDSGIHADADVPDSGVLETGKSTVFDGVNEYGDVASSVLAGATDGTVLIWAIPKDTGDAEYPPLFNAWVSGSASTYIPSVWIGSRNDTETIWFKWRDSSADAQIVHAVAAIPSTKWFFIGCRIEGEVRADCYVDEDLSDGVSLAALNDTSVPAKIAAELTGTAFARRPNKGYTACALAENWQARVAFSAAEIAEAAGSGAPIDYRTHSRYADIARVYRMGNSGPCGADSISGILNQASGCASDTIVLANMESGDITTSEGYPGS